MGFEKYFIPKKSCEKLIWVKRQNLQTTYNEHKRKLISSFCDQMCIQCVILNV